MDLRTERKVKFWLASLAKVLVIVLIVFKLIPYVFDTAKSSKDSTLTKKNEAIKVGKDSTIDNLIIGNTPGNGSKADFELTKQGSAAVSVGDTVKLAVPSNIKEVENSIGIFIFDENNLDRTVAGQLEKTILQEYQVKSVSPTPNKLHLLNGTMTGLGKLENVCIGTVSYTFKNNGAKITCMLQIAFDTYNVRSGFKLKNLSASLTRYGIGFSNEQAKDVAIRKINGI
ncbi:hypothetical protein ACFQZJ_06185 [Maribacter chungangensis]|uniref:Uncharacterized protein n=1 Tax=Maribacter chungangensis TaxID=1069117 RepID=A0ABW3B1M4_9FLAO